MRKLKVGIVGFGFIGPHHLDAIRRTGLAEVVAIAAQPKSEAEKAAKLHGIAKAYGDWTELVADPEIEVVDVATPTYLHAPIAIAAAQAGKHVIVDKPMALSSVEGKRMLDAALKAGVMHAVTFSIRYNVMVQQARAMVRRGDLGDIRFITGCYHQEWLLKATDYNWRVEPEYAGHLAMVADAGAHWYDMIQHVTGLKITKVLADLPRFIPRRQRPSKSGGSEWFDVEIPDVGMVMFEFENGARAMFSTGAIHAGHKNDLTFEINGSNASVRWQQEHPNQLWIGHRDEPNQILMKDPGLLDPSVAQYAKLPGGHNEAWADAFRNLMSNILGAIVREDDPQTIDPDHFPTFKTGLQIAHIVDAIEASASAGGQWTAVA